MTELVKYKIFTIIILTSVLPVNYAAGQDIQGDSLMHYIEIAARNNPTVLQRYAEYQAALQKVPQVGSLPDPELSFGVFLRPMELIMGKQAADLKLMQMFPWFGTLKSARDEMSLMAKAKFESFREAKFQVYFDVRSTWYDLYKINQDVRISDKNLQILRTIERLALIHYRTSTSGSSSPSSSSMGSAGETQSQNTSGNPQGMTGMSGGGQATATPSAAGSSGSMQGSSMESNSVTTLADLYRIQIEISDLENSLALLDDKLNSVTARFNSLLNRPMQSAVAVVDTLISDTLFPALDIVPDSILKNNPMLGMLEYEKQSLEARKKMVTRMGYPMMGLGVDYSLIQESEMVTSPMNGRDMIMPMISVSLPVFRKKYRAMQTEAEILATSTVWHYNATANSLMEEYYRAVQSYQDAKRKIKLYSDQYQLASKSLDIMLKSFSTAGGSLTDILIIHQQMLDYELKQSDAVADFNTSVAWLEKLMAISQNQ